MRSNTSAKSDVAKLRWSVVSRPEISVVVAVFNEAGTLSRCIASVVEQTYPKKELIIIDGGSTDGTLSILQQQDDRIAYWESSPDRGIYHAWNKALEHARGDWICFLGADDCFWSKTTLEQTVPHLCSANSVSRVVYGKVALVASDGRVIEMRGQPWQQARKAFVQGVPGASLPHQGVFHHRSLFQDGNHFDETFRIAGDFEFLLRTLKNGEPLFLSDLIVAGMGHGGVSTSAQNALASLREASRARRVNGVTGMAPLWYWTYAKATARDLVARCSGEAVAQRATNLYRRLTGRQSI